MIGWGTVKITQDMLHSSCVHRDSQIADCPNSGWWMASLWAFCFSNPISTFVASYENAQIIKRGTILRDECSLCNRSNSFCFPIKFSWLSCGCNFTEGQTIDCLTTWKVLSLPLQNKRYPWTSQFAVIFQHFNNISLGDLKDLCCQSSDYGLMSHGQKSKIRATRRHLQQISRHQIF